MQTRKAASVELSAITWKWVRSGADVSCQRH